MRDQLLPKYLESLEDKAGKIKALWEAHLEGGKSALDEIRLHAHSLKGSGGTFGFPEVSRAGEELEHANDTEFRDKLVSLLNLLGSITSRDSAAAANDDDSHARVPQRARSRQALVVQRNAENARNICQCVNRLEDIEGCVVAATGADARRAYLETGFALVILDIVLPDRDGREILREIKTTPALNCPVLVISGVPSDRIYMECMNMGADQYLSKPFDTDKLFFECSQVLGQTRLKTAAAAEVTPIAADSRKHALLRDEKILVAEDDEIQALFITEKLQDAGAQVTVAQNGQQALEALEADGFSAVILDGMMPVMDGFETLKRIRDMPRLKGLPVIMVTAMGSEDDIIRGYRHGANDYILKPFSEEQLVSRIKNMLVIAA